MTAAVEADLRVIARLPFPPIPKHARLVRFSGLPPAWSGTAPVDEVAWILSSSAAGDSVLSWTGEWHFHPAGLGQGSPTTLAREARFLAGIRKARGREAIEAAAPHHGTPQFEVNAWSTSEALVAAWALERGDRASAALLAVPAQSTLKEGWTLLTVPTAQISFTLTRQMLAAFAARHDYPAALSLARHLLRPEHGPHRFRRLAEELARQLPLRMNDFHALALPSPDGWRTLSAKLSRGEQVDYLVDRLRLHDQMEPENLGGYPAEEDDAPHGAGRIEAPVAARPVVIDPVQTLKAMNLRVDELPWLFDHVLDGDYTPWLSIGWSRCSGGCMVTVGELIEDLILNVVGFDLVDGEHLRGVPPARRAERISELETWCRRHAGDGVDSLEREGLRRTRDRWHFLRLCRSRAAARDAAAVPIIIDRVNDFGGTEAEVATVLHQIDSPAAVPWARQQIRASSGGPSHTDLESRFHAALILLKHGGAARGEGLRALKDVVAASESHAARAEPWLSPRENRTLQEVRCRNAGTPAADFGRPGGEAELITLLRRGCGSAFDWMERKLRSESLVSMLSFDAEPTSVRLTIRMVEGDQAAIVVSVWKGEPPYRLMRSDAERRLHRRRLAAWLREQRARIERGEKVTFSR